MANYLNRLSIFLSTVVVPLCLPFGALVFSQHASAQEPQCEDTPEGRICQVQQPITNGALVGTAGERDFGLITVNGGCSGTLMNRYWILTARHCVTTDATVAGALPAADTLAITATWAPGMNIRPTEIRDFGINVPTPGTDIVMLFLGRGDFGEVNRHLPFITQRGPTTAARWVGARLQGNEIVSQFGRGRPNLATGSFLAVPPTAVAALPGGTYFTGNFTPSLISEAGYTLALNSGQVGHGGDSGGPTFVFDGNRRFVAGVQSTCTATGYVPGAPITPPATNPGWMWATGISACQYVSVERFVREIGRNMGREPECSDINSCPITAAIDYVLDQAPISAVPAVSYLMDDLP